MADDVQPEPSAPEPSAAPKPPAPRRRGRRPRGENTRQTILASARELFLAQGYDRVSLRAVARHAGVDPALVHHYFDGKPDLFVASLTAADVSPLQALVGLRSVDPEHRGEHVVRTFLEVWDRPETHGAFMNLMQVAMNPDDGIRPFREFVIAEIFSRLPVPGTGSADVNLRGQLVASQLLGMAVARYVVRLPDIAAASHDQLAVWIGPTIQRYLDGQ